ncbi:MAG: hypothetical protein V4689_21050 [Verrucomicrobiota bacterium]
MMILNKKLSIWLAVPFVAFTSACKDSSATSGLAEQIGATGLVLNDSIFPVSLIKLSPGESRSMLLEPDPNRYIGFHVQGIGEDLVATHKATGKYPATLVNSDNESEAFQTSYGAATHFNTTNSDGKLALRVESRHPNPIFVVIYTSPAD